MTNINQAIAMGLTKAVEDVHEAKVQHEYKPVTFADLTPEHKRKWDDTFKMMIYKFPGFQHMWANMLNGQHLTPPSEYVPIFTRDVPIAATDAKSILLNPDTFFEVGLLQRVFVACHEVVHNARGDVEFLRKCVAAGKVPMHDGSTLPMDNDTMQKCMDAVINAGLIEGNMGKPLNEFRGEPVGHFDKDVKPTDNFLDVYKKYYEETFGGEGDEPGEGPGKGPQPNPNGNNPGGFDNLLPPGSATGTQHQRDDGKWRVVTDQAAHIERSARHGKLPAGLERLFKQLLEPEVPWVDHIETLVMRSVGDGSLDWTQPDPWLGSTPEGESYFAPKTTGMGAGWIAIWGDTSGSRDDKQIAADIGECSGIMEAVNPERLTVAWGDAAIHHVDEIDDATDLMQLKPKGGGGTEMEPFLEWVREQSPDEPDLIIAFTDGYLDFPREAEFPRCPIIWAIDNEVANPPYGNVVRRGKIRRAL